MQSYFYYKCWCCSIKAMYRVRLPQCKLLIFEMHQQEPDFTSLTMCSARANCLGIALLSTLLYLFIFLLYFNWWDSTKVTEQNWEIKGTTKWPEPNWKACWPDTSNTTHVRERAPLVVNSCQICSEPFSQEKVCHNVQRLCQTFRKCPPVLANCKSVGIIHNPSQLSNCFLKWNVIIGS